MNTLDAAVDNLADAVERLDAALRARRTLGELSAQAGSHAETAADRLDQVIERLHAALER